MKHIQQTNQRTRTFSAAVLVMSSALLVGCDRMSPKTEAEPTTGTQAQGVLESTTSSTSVPRPEDKGMNQGKTAAPQGNESPATRDGRPAAGANSPLGARVDVTDSRDNAKDMTGYKTEEVRGIYAQAGKDATAPSSPTATTVNPSAFQEARAINLNAYPYDRRSQLRSVLETRMTTLDRGIDQLRASINAKPNNGGNTMQERISDIAQKYDGADDRLKGLETVRPENWSNYTRQLRDEIASLEAAYQQLQVAAK